MSKDTHPSIHQNQSHDHRMAGLFRLHYAELCRGVYRLLRDTTLAEDLVQEVFLKIWERKDHVEMNDRFVFYLKRSCYHEALKYLSSHQYRDNTDPASATASPTQADHELLEAELHQKIQQAIARLPEKTRLIFSLSRFDELTYPQIAAQLGLSIKSVEKHMGKALRNLREQLSEHLISWVGLATLSCLIHELWPILT